MVDAGARLQEARAAYGRRDWVAARDAFDAADAVTPLPAEDLYARASCAWWLGDLDDCVPTTQAAYRRFLAEGRPAAAAAVALDVAYTSMLRGQEAAASGWLQRARRLLEDRPVCVEQGLLRYVDAEQAFHGHDLDTADAFVDEVRAIGERFADATLCGVAAVLRGRILIRRGEVAAGAVLLDEAMVAAVGDDLDPGWAGNIYCHLMLACVEIADLRRAGEWTEATARWCEQMPGAGPFLGICRVHRAQVLQVRGDWDRAEAELRRVCDEQGDFGVDVVAEAHYQRGELRRLFGDLAGADLAYLEAHQLGRDPQPGAALLSAARGRHEAASASIERVLADVPDAPLARAPYLPARVEIALAAGDQDAALAATEELEALAATYDTHGFAAASAAARGATLLAGGDAAGALPALQRAVAAWRELGAPHEIARLRGLVARALEAVGDHDGADRERRAARLERPPSVPTVADGHGAVALDGTAVDVVPTPMTDGLTPRETEVLHLVAGGRSNQQIADELVLSVRTVERHLASTYQKLGLSGRSARAAAVSYALRQGLFPRG
jgi:DNA-binding CsgD family transcriptional regulator